MSLAMCISLWGRRGPKREYRARFRIPLLFRPLFRTLDVLQFWIYNGQGFSFFGGHLASIIWFCAEVGITLPFQMRPTRRELDPEPEALLIWGRSPSGVQRTPFQLFSPSLSFVPPLFLFFSLSSFSPNCSALGHAPNLFVPLGGLKKLASRGCTPPRLRGPESATILPAVPVCGFAACGAPGGA